MSSESAQVLCSRFRTGDRTIQVVVSNHRTDHMRDVLGEKPASLHPLLLPSPARLYSFLSPRPICLGSIFSPSPTARLYSLLSPNPTARLYSPLSPSPAARLYSLLSPGFDDRHLPVVSAAEASNKS